MTEGPGLTTSGPQDFQPFRSFPDSYFLFSCFPFPVSYFFTASNRPLCRAAALR
jgi:hypothetical protein